MREPGTPTVLPGSASGSAVAGTCTEGALRESEQRLRVVIQAASEGIVMMQDGTGAGVATVLNPAAERITGLTASQLRGLTPYPQGWYTVREDGTQLPPDERPPRVALRTGKSVNNVVLGHHLPDGTVNWCSVNSEPVFREGQTAPYAVVATFMDITAQRRQAAVQRQLEEQLQQARKLESIGRLAGGIAHDFNNLLTVILAGAQELRESVDTGVAVSPEVIDDIQAASRRAAELTGQLLSFARKQVIAPTALDLNAVVLRNEKLLRRVLGEDIELVARTAPGLWAARCDPNQLDQAILNLAINARDAMPAGGRLTLETSNVDVDAEFVARHPFMPAGAYVRLAVADTGVGMPPEVKARAFEPFFTTKPPGKGTGLGLATVYGIVKQSAGYVLLDSAVDRGTTFSLFFPRTEEVPGCEPCPVVASGGSETVLVVEDDPQVRALAVRALRSAGYRVLEAGGGEAALEVAAHEQGPIQLVVTDVVMPGLDGRQLAAALQRRRPELRVLLVSGYPGAVITQAAPADAEVELLTKPFTTGTLLARVRTLLDSAERETG